jgi:hypothetical protein
VAGPFLGAYRPGSPAEVPLQSAFRAFVDSEKRESAASEDSVPIDVPLDDETDQKVDDPVTRTSVGDLESPEHESLHDREVVIDGSELPESNGSPSSPSSPKQTELPGGDSDEQKDGAITKDDDEGYEYHDDGAGSPQVSIPKETAPGPLGPSDGSEAPAPVVHAGNCEHESLEDREVVIDGSEPPAEELPETNDSRSNPSSPKQTGLPDGDSYEREDGAMTKDDDEGYEYYDDAAGSPKASIPKEGASDEDLSDGIFSGSSPRPVSQPGTGLRDLPAPAERGSADAHEYSDD